MLDGAMEKHKAVKGDRRLKWRVYSVKYNNQGILSSEENV